MTSVLDVIAGKSGVFRAIAGHYGVEYSPVLILADEGRRRFAGEKPSPFAEAAESALKKTLGDKYADFQETMDAAITRRFAPSS